MAANDFQGYLFRTGMLTTSGTIFPLEYMQFNSWSSTPNQREEIKAYRDDNTRNLTRVTAAGRKTPISFKTRPNLNLAEKIAIQTFFTSAESNPDERKIHIVYWNDEENVYKEGDFYRPNMAFTIKKIEGNNIIYDELQIDLVEY